MKILPFPTRLPPAAQAELAELEAALDGDLAGPRAERWRELSSDVRALAPPLDPGFETALRERLAASRQPAPRRRRPAMLIAAAAAVLLALALALPLSLGGRAHPPTPHPDSAPAVGSPQRSGPAMAGESAAGPTAGAGATAEGQAQEAAPGRLQQLAAAIGLATTPARVQDLADRAGRLAVAEGGFVQSARVERQAQAGEATLTLSVPSGRLAALTAALARLAPVRSQSQSLQDITGSLESAERRLAAARAERAALLHALARAVTQGQIESLHARLAQNASAIGAAGHAVADVRRRAGTASVEVTIIGEPAAGGGFTAGAGLHDAGRVLSALLGGLAIAAAVLAPIVLVVWALLALGRVWARRRRERVLDGSAR